MRKDEVQATQEDLDLLLAARAARAHAYAPYSRFRVGAAVRTRSGRVYPGCNVENATSGLTLCAERVAIFSALSEGEREIDAIAVVIADGRSALPCGICRELIRECARGARILLANADGGVTVTTIEALLPRGG
jgi:cytidine deaminase